MQGSPWRAGQEYLDEATAVSRDQLGLDPEPLDAEHVQRPLPGQLHGQGFCGPSRHLEPRRKDRETGPGRAGHQGFPSSSLVFREGPVTPVGAGTLVQVRTYKVETSRRG